jgi:type 1 glutamine amidotransferase
MSDAATKSALIVRGGWEGHSPKEATELFVPFLEENGYDVRIEESPAVYADEATMAATDLIVQCVTMSTIEREQFQGLEAAVRGGVGLAGWHGGIADSYRATSDYLWLVGGQFATHPSRDDLAPEHEGTDRANFRDYRVELTPAGREHPITADIGDFEVHSEQYWVLSDDYNDVLATTTHPTRPDRPWSREVTCPAIWTRNWGAGRIFVATPGHDIDTLRVPAVRTVIERGMLWASR